MTVYILVVLVALGSFLTFVIRQFRQLARSISQSVDPTAIHPVPWQTDEVFRYLLFGLRAPKENGNWIQTSLLLGAWILAEHGYWTSQGWLIGSSLALILWLSWSLQYIWHRNDPWVPLVGVLNSCETIGDPALAKTMKRSAPEQGWWLMSLDSPEGPLNVVSSSFSLWRAKLTHRPSHPPQQGMALQGWWVPTKCPIVWHWGPDKPQSTSHPVITLIWFVGPLLFILGSFHITLLNLIIDCTAIVLLISAGVLRWSHNQRKDPSAS